MDYPGRRERALATLAEQDLSALLVTNPLHVRYLTGFTGEGFLLLTQRPVVCTDPRFGVEAREQAVGCQVVSGEVGHLQSLIAAARESGRSQLAFEPESLTWAQHGRLAEALGGERLVPVPGLLETMRLRKDPEEVALIARAAALADQALAALLPALLPGRTEKQLAWQFTQSVLEAGADDVSFPPIIASGPHAALPHATLSDRPLQDGDMVVVDVGAKLEGYCSDITRTVVIGEPPEKFAERYLAVGQAQAAGIAALAAGTAAAEVDRAAREVLEAAGLGEHFSHGLGHGVGLDVHEGPALSRRSTATLEVGNVVTVEPGIYLEGWGGIRIEDLFVIEEAGPRQLTAAARRPEA
jgi:Xaa-Pro aminopeptidase